MSLDYIDPNTAPLPPPVEWGGPIFPDPLLYSGAALWFILLIAALMGLLFYRQRLLDERLARKRAPEHIYITIRRALDQALLATGARTIDAGQKVADVLDFHLGPILLFSGGFGKPLGALRKALEGKTDPPPPEPVKHIPIKHESKSSEHGSQPAIVVSAGIRDRVVIAPAQIITPAEHGHGSGHDAGHGAGHAHPEAKRDMTAREQVVAVREALERISEYWRKESVERDLRKIQDAMSIPIAVKRSPPPRASAPLRRPPAPAVSPAPASTSASAKP